jgi:hypothetical protein
MASGAAVSGTCTLPQPVEALVGRRIIRVALSETHAAAVELLPDGNTQLWSWGTRAVGVADAPPQLDPAAVVKAKGRGSLDIRSADAQETGNPSVALLPQLVFALQNERIVDVACGLAHTLALTADGRVFAFGVDRDGAMGVGDRLPRLTPTLVQGLEAHGPIVAVAAGNGSSLFVSANGTLLAASGPTNSCQIREHHRVAACTLAQTKNMAFPLEVSAETLAKQEHSTRKPLQLNLARGGWGDWIVERADPPSTCRTVCMQAQVVEDRRSRAHTIAVRQAVTLEGLPRPTAVSPRSMVASTRVLVLDREDRRAVSHTHTHLFAQPYGLLAPMVGCEQAPCPLDLTRYGIEPNPVRQRACGHRCAMLEARAIAHVQCVSSVPAALLRAPPSTSAAFRPPMPPRSMRRL